MTVTLTQHLGVFDMFRIGIGPSSSHTVGPMRAARLFMQKISEPELEALASITVQLFGSLGATGRGHATDRAVLLGLAGHDPSTVPQDVVQSHADDVRTRGELTVRTGTSSDRGKTIPFDATSDILFTPRTVLPGHPNALMITARDATGGVVREGTYYSIGGGFVLSDDDVAAEEDVPTTALGTTDSRVPTVPHPFTTGQELLEVCRAHGLRVCEVMAANERAVRSPEDVSAHCASVWQAMDDSIQAGVTGEGLLPGNLLVPRRAPAMYRKLRLADHSPDPLSAMDWIGLYALAVNEENASGHRIVTAPTNGAAGIVPAVLKYFLAFVCTEPDPARQIEEYLLTAAAIGTIIKRNASIAGAEVGCQGEVGSACAMAAAGLAEVLGGTPEQVENAAEIAMEHNLGLTCDPVGGLVQVPCIERNAVGAVKAITAARMAIHGDGTHTVSLDAVVETMRQTGLDMHSKYKETSTGGLAVNIIEC